MPASRFSSAPQGRYYQTGPANTEEAKARMMHMEAQLSQLTGMVEKALKNKKLGKKQVSLQAGLALIWWKQIRSQRKWDVEKEPSEWAPSHHTLN